MKKTHWLGAAAALSLSVTLVACNTASSDGAATAEYEAASDHDAALARLAEIEMNPDTSFLTDEERQVVNKLIQVAGYMDEIYRRQVDADYDAAAERVAGMNDASLQKRFDTFFGCWDSLHDDLNFCGEDTPRPQGAGFYPKDLTKEEFDAYLEANPDEAEALTSPYTVVKRDGDKLIAVPYSEEYKQWLEPAAKLMEEAAEITSSPTLKRFLTLRAESFRTDEYYESELAWMDLEGPIEAAIGPYEVYTDTLYGRKTAFEAFITLRDPEESKKLDVYKSRLRDMEANLPVDEKYKNFRRGFESPISVVDQVHGGGDNVPGTQTIAFNLPNDERVREAKGAKKVILANVLGAKFDRILAPMAEEVLVQEDAARVTKKYMEAETLFHELSHSLGPGTITVDGRETTVDKELKDLASGLEEAKADAMGSYNVLYMMDEGLLPADEKDQLRATYVVGLFRALRRGTNEAHGKGSAMQYRILRDRGALVWDEEAERFRIDHDKFDEVLAEIVAIIVKLQGDGDYAGVQKLFKTWGSLDAEAQSVIDRTTNIPVDIRPIYPDSV